MSLPEGLKLHPTYEKYVYQLVITDAQDVEWITFPTIREYTDRADSIDWIVNVVLKTCIALKVTNVFNDEDDHITASMDLDIMEEFVTAYYSDGDEEDFDASSIEADPMQAQKRGL